MTKGNLKIDMSAFVGKDFDLECYSYTQEKFLPLYGYGKTVQRITSEHRYRPRLNKPQVLDNWSWVPDGLVWEAVYRTENGNSEDRIIGNRVKRNISSKRLKNMTKNIEADGEYRIYHIESVSCIGVKPEYKEWGEQHDFPVIIT